MADKIVKIYGDARFIPRHDTLENWQTKNPVLLQAEPSYVIDGKDGEKIKFGDGVTPWDELPYLSSSINNGGDITVDQTYNPESENPQSGKAIATEIERVNNTFAPVIKNTASGSAIFIEDIASAEHTLAVKVSSDDNIDLTSVKVKTGGKNLLSYPYTSNATTNNGITWTVNSDGTIIANGTATAQSIFYLRQHISLQAGKMFVQGLGDSYNKGIGMVFNNIGYVYADDKTVNIPDGYKNTIYLFVKSGTIVDNVLIKPPFACYNDDDIVKEYEVNSDGTVEGVKSISPQMNIFTDTLGVNIACEYNADTKKYIDNKFAELQALVLEG